MTKPQAPVGERDGEWQTVPKGAVVIGPNTISGLPHKGGSGDFCPPWREPQFDNHAARVVVWFDTWNDATSFVNAIKSPPPEPTVDTTKLNAGQLVQRIMRAMDGDVSSFTTASLAEYIVAEILKLPKDYWRKPPPETRAAGVTEEEIARAIFNQTFRNSLDWDNSSRRLRLEYLDRARAVLAILALPTIPQPPVQEGSDEN